MKHKCVDERLGGLLHQYELNLLPRRDLKAFEVHLLECDHCFEEVAKFRESAQILRDDHSLRELAATALQERPSGTQRKWSANMANVFRIIFWRGWPRRIGLATILILVAFVLRPWKFEIYPTDDVSANGNLLTVAAFRDLTGDTTVPMAKMIQNLLITDLDESRYFSVLSGQRIKDLSRRLGYETSQLIEPNAALRVAREAKARWLLMGEILGTGERPEIMSQLIAVEDGRLLATQRIDAGAGESIFSIADRLSNEVRKDLALPPGANLESGRSVSAVTTSSPEAYGMYVAGLEDYYKLYWIDARKSLEQALQFDSTFAMVYYYLSNISHEPEALEYIQKALKYSHKATGTERQYILARHAYLSGNADLSIKLLADLVEQHPDAKDAHLQLSVLFLARHEIDKAIGHLRLVTMLDPMNKHAYNVLAYCYSSQGDAENALAALDQYIDLAPDEANPYDTRGEILRRHGRLQESLESYEKALQIKPDFRSSLLGLGDMRLFAGNIRGADSCFRAWARLQDPGRPAMISHHLALAPIFEGRLMDAIGILEAGKLADAALPDTGDIRAIDRFLIDVSIARLLGAKGDYEAALTRLKASLDRSYASLGEMGRKGMTEYIRILAESGDTEKAKTAAVSLRADIMAAGGDLSRYEYCLACIALAEGKPEEAVNRFEKFLGTFKNFVIEFMYARALLEADEPEKALQIWQRLTRHYTPLRRNYGVWSAELSFYIGRALEAAGRDLEATEYYTAFLEAWKNADIDIREVACARERLRALQSK